MKKGISCFILFALVFSLFICACGTTEPEVFDEEFVHSTGGYNLEGYEMLYRCGEDDSFLDYEPDTYFYDKAKQRIADVEEKLNCKINIIHAVWDDTENMRKAVASGTYYGDAFRMIGDKLEDAAELGLLVGYSTLSDYIDIKDSDKWGNKYQLESVSLNDDIYAVLPYYWPEQAFTEIGYIITMNEDTISKIGETDPREYVENKEWTWSKFRECLGNFTKIEGSETTIYASQYPNGAFAQMYLSSNGSNLIKVDSFGNAVYGFNDEKAMKAMQEALDVKKEYSYAFSKTSINEEIISEFASGKIVMYYSDSQTLLETIAYKVENFGLVKWPTGPDVDPDYTFSIHNNIHPIGISILARDINSTAIILNEIYEPFEGFETQEAIQDYMKKGVFFDERDCKTFFDMIENTRFAYFHYNISPTLSSYIDMNKTVVECVSAMEQSTLSAFEDNVTPCVKGITAVYGSYED